MRAVAAKGSRCHASAAARRERSRQLAEATRVIITWTAQTASGPRTARCLALGGPKHLRSADFFDVASHPEITFKSTRVEKFGEEQLRVVGDPTIRGVTRDVVLEVEYAGQTKDPWGNVRAGFAAKTSIDRKDFGLTWNQLLEAGGVMVGDRIDIEIEIEAVKQTAVKAA